MARLTDTDGNLLGGLNQPLPVIDEHAAADLLLERVFRSSGGNTHHPVDLQIAGQELGLSIPQIMPLLSSLVGQGLLLPVEEPGRMALYLTPGAVKKMVSVQTRR